MLRISINSFGDGHGYLEVFGRDYYGRNWSLLLFLKDAIDVRR